jgi:alanine racemase
MINLYEILDATNGQLLGVPAAQLFESFSVDAETISQGQMFVVTSTRIGDSHQFIAQAIANGATGVICTHPPECNTHGVSVILVRDTVDALLLWAQYVLGRYGTKVIAVIGSAGKSTTVDAISRLLSTQGAVHCELDSAVGRLSVPFALARLKPSDKFVILKLNIMDVGDMAAFAQAAQPEAVVVTNIDPYHPGTFVSAQQVASEMRVLTDLLPPSGLAVLNYDDDLVRGLGATTRATVKMSSTASFGADVMAYNLKLGLDGTSFDLRFGGERRSNVSVVLLGKHQLSCLLSALSVGVHYGVPIDVGLGILADIQPLQGRLTSLEGQGGVHIIDASDTASPQYMLDLLDWVDSIRKKNQRVIFLFGDMDNLGSNAINGHRIVGRKAANVSHIFITQGAQAGIAARAALDYGMDSAYVHACATSQDVLKTLDNHYTLGEDDLILIAGGDSANMDFITQTFLANDANKQQLGKKNRHSDKRLLSHPTRLTWVEIIGEHVTLMAVVKSDAYGHGAVMTARTALVNGAEYLGVSSLQEALILRDAGISAPILTLNYTPSYMARQAIQHDITLTVFDAETARAYNRAALDVGTVANVHVKVDTGLGRFGILPEFLTAFFRQLMTMQNLNVEGVYTHFSSADEKTGYTEQQLKTFKQAIKPLKETVGYNVRYLHTSNSAGTIAHPAARFDLVRPGIALYGMNPSASVPLPDGFQPAFTWKAMIAQVKTLPAGHPVGYGNTYITQTPERVGIIPVGYGDGFRRGPQPSGCVLVHGRRAPIIGRISMEKTVISLQNIPDVAIGDEVVILGQQGDERITADEIAQHIGTINYEVTCNALARLPRL